jgi:hypothetical protein
MRTSIQAASISVEPLSPYTHNVDNTVFYATSSLTVDQTEGFQTFNVTQGISADGSGTQRIQLTVTADADAASGSTQVIQAFAKDLSGSLKVIPIAWVGSSACAANSTCYKSVTSNSVVIGYELAAVESDGATNIGIYPYDICKYYAGALQGCDFSSPYGVQTTTSNNFEIAIYVQAISNSQLNTSQDLHNNTSALHDEIKLHFQSSAPLMTCPADADTIYNPGDQSISVNATAFTYNRQNFSSSDISKLIVIANEAALNTSGTFGDTSTNSVVGRVDATDGSGNVTGFLNTTTGSDHLYNVQFSARDSSGAISNFTTCGISSKIATSQIQGFLTKNKCFIATASYRRENSWGLSLLRDFRDQFLSKTLLGQQFIAWYYDWSPRAAQWLIQHPTFRHPILLALIPLQVIAWVMLHPVFYGLILLGLLILLKGFGLLNFNSAQTFFRRRKNRISTYFVFLFLLLNAPSLRADPANSPSTINDDLSHLKAPYPLKGNKGNYFPKNSFTFEVMTLSNHTITNPDTGVDYGQIYPSSWIPDFRLSYEWRPFNSEELAFAYLGIQVHSGVFFSRGKGAFEFELTKPSGASYGSQSDVYFSFIGVPLLVGPHLQLNTLKYFRPTLSVAGGILGAIEHRNDTQANTRLMTGLMDVSLGFNILLDGWNTSDEWDLYLSHHVKHYSLTCRYSWLSSFGKKLTFSQTGVLVGLNYEF